MSKTSVQSISARKLTHTYLEQPARYNYIATALAIVIVTLSTFWIGYHIGGSDVLFTEITYGLSAFLGALWAFRTAYRARYGPVLTERSYQLAWFFVGLGLTINLCGRITFTFFSLLGNNTFPGIADIFFNIFYILIFVAILLISCHVRFRLRMYLDGLISMLSFVGVWWFFVIGPAYLSLIGNKGPTTSEIFKLALGLTYPAWNILLFLLIILFFLLRSQRRVSPAILLFGSALILNACGDMVFGYSTLFNVYQPGNIWIDPLRYASYLLMGLASLYEYADLARKKYKEMLNPSDETTSGKHHVVGSSIRLSNFGRRVFTLLVHLPLTLLLGLTVYSAFFRSGLLSISLVVLTAIVGMLVSVRYSLASSENEALLVDRELRHQESEQLRRMMTQLTEILSEELLRECIVNMVIDDLDFASAMLLLIENQQTAEQVAQIQVYAATNVELERQHWSFQGDNLLQLLSSSGQIHEVQWENQQHVPTEVRLWCREQHIDKMTFLPLNYQGQNLGSLGVMRRDNIRLNHHDISLMLKYTEQVTAIIEHAHLYKEAREREKFSRAMATIATRLNAAVVEPAEIGLVICKEGANILHADYAFFYRADDERHLKPLAAYMHEQDSALALEEWPLIQSYEYEAQALHALQPVLLHIPVQENRQKLGTPPALPPIEQSPRKSVSTHLSSTRNSGSRKTQSLRIRLAQYHIQTVILAPIVANGEPIGLLIFARSQPPGVTEKRPFTSEDLIQTQDFVEQAAVPFINAQLYQDLQTAHQRLQELDQLKDQFMVTASHELRTPLTAVQGYIELLAQFDEQLPAEQRRDFLEKARRGCDELAVLLGNVMDASRLEVEAGIRPALLKRTSVQETVESILMLIEPHITQEQREVYVNIQPRLLVMADPPRLRQVLMNISVNALKYSPPETPLAFRARTILDQEQKYVVISISDKGKGIAPADQGQLFQRFVRLESDMNSPVRGSGLGLYISRSLINAMGGKIWIESKGIPGEGTTFHIQLPAAR